MMKWLWTFLGFYCRRCGGVFEYPYDETGHSCLFPEGGKT